jgi:hypothetical protein
MSEYDRIRAEAEAIQLLRPTEGLKVIMSELQLRIDSCDRSVDIGDPVWAQRVAHRDGKADGLREMLTWIKGRLLYISDSDSPPEA